MKIIVTGGSGFVGRVLVEKLDKEGFDTYSMDRRSTGRNKEIIMDLTLADERQIRQNLIDSDCIVHLAAYPNFSSSFNFQTYETNCFTNLKIVNALRNSKAHFIFASNALISGVKMNLIKQDSPDMPEIPYNIAKFISEQYIKNNIESQSILRIGGIYGYDGPKHLFLNKAIMYAINNITVLPLSDNGSGRRNYIYIDDLCNWILHIINTKKNGTYLIAGKETLPMRSIFSELFDVFIGKGNYEYNKNALDGFDQVIETDYPEIYFHSYRSAFLNIQSSFKK